MNEYQVNIRAIYESGDAKIFRLNYQLYHDSIEWFNQLSKERLAREIPVLHYASSIELELIKYNGIAFFRKENILFSVVGNRTL